ncbi:MAG: rRNA cytosine-C5-methyltransferase, partial [Bacteroidaceae bacterium]|nr:rRNA cytosine-C5-methyltransferase [Bacteroidaceae bacterium]
SFTFDPLFHAGAYYVQEAGSMFVAETLRQHLPDQPLVALDLCAAPGGKSTLLRSLLHPDSLLVCNEPIRQRAQVLAENIQKWGSPQCVVTQNYPEHFTLLTHLFDVVVADVPCSGEGMFRKDEEAIQDWSLQNVEMCVRRQRDILRDVWSALKPGGLLVYSTCTFNRHEDEENVDWLCKELGAERLTVAVQPEWGICGSYHFFPSHTRGEGFFLSIVRKRPDDFTPLPLKVPKCQQSDTPPSDVRDWLSAGEWSFVRSENLYTAVPRRHEALMNMLRKHLHVLTEGVPLAELRGRDWTPCHALALNTALRRGAFPEAEVTYEQAIAYLRREAINVTAPRGYVLVTYHGLPLGFVKNIGSRANNLYPQEWRIRTTFVPSSQL